MRKYSQQNDDLDGMHERLTEDYEVLGNFK